MIAPRRMESEIDRDIHQLAADLFGLENIGTSGLSVRAGTHSLRMRKTRQIYGSERMTLSLTGQFHMNGLRETRSRSIFTLKIIADSKHRCDPQSGDSLRGQGSRIRQILKSFSLVSTRVPSADSALARQALAVIIDVTM